MDKGTPTGILVDEIVPIDLVKDQDRICGYLDGLNAVVKQYAHKPSGFVEGALFLCNEPLRHNPDWIAQAAHSLREAGYLFSGSPGGRKRTKQFVLSRLHPIIQRFYTKKPRSQKVEKILRTYLIEAEAAAYALKISELTHIFAEISHHHSRRRGDCSQTLKRLVKLGLANRHDTHITDEMFLSLVRVFLNTIASSISKHITIHNNIDHVCDSIANGYATKRQVALLIASNTDARRYFYSKLPKSVACFSWIRDNGFLDLLQKPAEDTSQYSYRTPELQYLIDVANVDAASVVDYVLSEISISKDTFNPEVVDRLLWIATTIDATQLSRLVPKIRDEQWIPLMGTFNRWGFEYKQMFETLASANDSNSIVTLAEAVLSVRTSEDIEKGTYGKDNPFYFNDLHHSEVFERLCEVDDTAAESALALTSRVFSEVIRRGEREDDVFEIGEAYPLFDVDFFKLEVGDKRHYSFRDDVRDLAATVKTLTARLLRNQCGNKKEVRRVYNTYVANLPDSRSLWRFRLYVWSLCPAVFTSDIRNAFFRAFESDKHLWAIAGGAEYEWALQKTFGQLPKSDREEYKQRVFETARKDESVSIEYGILSSIYEYLTDKEKEEAATIFKLPLKADYHPEPSIGVGRGGTVVPQAPPGGDEQWQKPVPEIVKLLKTTWSPENVRKLDGENDFLRPINAEGVAEKLRENIATRLSEYVASAHLFFDRAGLDSHYTYSFLRGVQEAVRADSTSMTSVDWKPLFAFTRNLIRSGTETLFDRRHEDTKKQYDAWLAGWASVHQTLADVLQELLHERSGKIVIDFEQHRKDLLEVIAYLLQFPDPVPEDEVPETARSKTKKPDSDEYLISEPFITAINTARGRSFQAFLYFVEQDSKRMSNDRTSKLSDDVKRIYQAILECENTQAIMFMFGHYLAFFYYRDQEWMTPRIRTIFSHDESRKDLYLAAWEGYLSASLYKELFVLLHDEYRYAIQYDPEAYTKREYRSHPDEGLATHLALAYTHYDNFDLKEDLFVEFWSTPNTKRHAAFVSFIGRTVISRDQPEKWLLEHPEVKVEKLMQFWDWILARMESSEVYKEFGFWMQAKYGAFDHKQLADHIDRTLEKTGGDLDWELGMMSSLPYLVKADPAKTLSILRRYLVDGSVVEQARGYVRTESEDFLETLRTLYQNTETKEGTYALINVLLPLGNGHFWKLKDVLKD